MIQKVRGAYYVTGPSGSGKTTAAHTLLRMGYNAIDADAHLAEFVNTETGEIATELRPDEESWTQIHRLMMNPGKLQAALDEYKDSHIFICVATHNQQEFFPLFRKLFFLELSKETLLERLKYAREHDYGKKPFQRQRIMRDLDGFRRVMEQAKAVKINAEQTPEAIARQLISEAARDNK